MQHPGALSFRNSFSEAGEEAVQIAVDATRQFARRDGAELKESSVLKPNVSRSISGTTSCSSLPSPRSSLLS
ncbi:hypothetical protein SCA6_004501 [Theobroma cacao]